MEFVLCCKRFAVDQSFLLQNLIIFRGVGCEGCDYAKDNEIMKFMLCLLEVRFKFELLVTKPDCKGCDYARHNECMVYMLCCEQLVFNRSFMSQNLIVFYLWGRLQGLWLCKRQWHRYCGLSKGKACPSGGFSNWASRLAQVHHLYHMVCKHTDISTLAVVTYMWTWQPSYLISLPELSSSQKVIEVVDWWSGHGCWV